MSELHELAVGGQSKLESVDPQFVRDGLLNARKKTWHAFDEIRKHLREGMTEGEANKLSREILNGLGSKKDWHKPYVRFGPGTALSFRDPIQKEYRLKLNDPVYIDLGPVWSDDSGLEYEGDVGDTYVLGENAAADRCAAMSRQIFNEAREKWKDEKMSGVQIYEFLARRADETGYQLLEKVDGHRVADFPHAKYSKERLAGLTFPPTSCLWVLEVQLINPERTFGAFYEDVLE